MLTKNAVPKTQPGVEVLLGVSANIAPRQKFPEIGPRFISAGESNRTRLSAKETAVSTVVSHAVGKLNNHYKSGTMHARNW
jgi:hypothetical protein